MCMGILDGGIAVVTTLAEHIDTLNFVLKTLPECNVYECNCLFQSLDEMYNVMFTHIRMI